MHADIDAGPVIRHSHDRRGFHRHVGRQGGRKRDHRAERRRRDPQTAVPDIHTKPHRKVLFNRT